jgi:transcription-repair coupling factor (superfamily II helicase)
MRDLEIRGAGEMLGTRQHGLIAAVGFHLYTRLLAKAVNDLKRSGKLAPSMGAAQASLYHPIINVDLPIEVGIPPEYVEDKPMRLKLYRRLADIHDLSEIDALQAEFDDRFGAPPESVMNLLYQLKVRVLAEQAGVVSISIENKQMALRFPARRPHEAPRHFPNLGADARTSKNTVWLTNLEGANWRSQLLTVLERLQERQVAKAKGQASQPIPVKD